MEGLSESEKQKSIALDQKKCVHFTGISNDKCKAEVVYKTVYDYPPEAVNDHTVLNLQIPCTSSKYCRVICEKREFPTLAESTQKIENREKRIIEHFEMLSKDICPTHKQPITKTQVGKCVYAKECGCRLYQGKLSK